ncbi:hypothetical protein D3C86_1745750 [compost metagenome]
MLNRIFKTLDDKIYYLNQEILEQIAFNFDLIDQRPWYELYQHKIDKTYWRLDKPDKYQVQFFVKVDNFNEWFNYDSTELQIDLLLKTRGNSTRKCVWVGCNKIGLQGLVYCQVHAYKEMGIRK